MCGVWHVWGRARSEELPTQDLPREADTPEVRFCLRVSPGILEGNRRTVSACLDTQTRMRVSRMDLAAAMIQINQSTNECSSRNKRLRKDGDQ